MTAFFLRPKSGTTIIQFIGEYMMNYEEFKENLANDVKEQMESKYGSEVTVETRMEITDIFHIHGVKIKLFLIHIPPKYKKAATSAALIRFHLTVGFTFAEMLFAVLILGIATGLMAQTVGVAFNNFEKITKKSEAQMLCSVLVASVQDELLYAKNIKAGTVPEYFSSSRDMGESCKIVAATYSGSDSADAYSGASTNGELCVYSDYSASGESADTDSVKYYPLVAHASYAPQNRVGVNTHSDYLTS